MDSVKQSRPVFLYILLGILVLAVAGSAVLSSLALTRLSALDQSVGNMNGSLTGVTELTAYLQRLIGSSGEDIAQENDVTIGGQYVIRSTEAISGAYLSGDRSSLSDREKETLDMAGAILGEIIRPEMTPFEKECAVYDWMCENLSHESGGSVAIPTASAESDNPHGVLKHHSAVCVGFATTFRLFLQMLEIPCMVVHDSYLSHSWDLVQLDGQWYHTDIYMDVGSGNYQSFNMNDTLCAEGHQWNTEFFPAATGAEFSYAWQHCVLVNDYFTLPETLRQGIADGQKRFFYRFESPSDQDLLAIATMMNQISAYFVGYYYESNAAPGSVSLTGGLAGAETDCVIVEPVPSDAAFSWSWTVGMDEQPILCVFLDMGKPDPTPVLPDDVQSRIDNAVNNAFGSQPSSYLIVEALTFADGYLVCRLDSGDLIAADLVNLSPEDWEFMASLLPTDMMLDLSDAEKVDMTLTAEVDGEAVPIDTIFQGAMLVESGKG